MGRSDGKEGGVWCTLATHKMHECEPEDEEERGSLAHYDEM